MREVCERHWSATRFVQRHRSATRFMQRHRSATRFIQRHRSATRFIQQDFRIFFTVTQQNLCLKKNRLEANVLILAVAIFIILVIRY
jgi:hypothetical protein